MTAPVPPSPLGVRVDPGPARLGSVLVGAVGGLLAGAGALATVVALGLAQGQVWLRPVNVVGAVWIRWLQGAAPQALDSFYLDALLAGIGSTLLVGGLLGGLLALALERLPEDQPFSWGLLWGLMLALLLHGSRRSGWGLGQALNPLLAAELGWRGLLAAGLVFGALLGAWLQVDRRDH